MREIKFRGKDFDNDEWVYGGVDNCGENIIRHGAYGGSVYCKDGTIGQYTGLKDKNDKEIYEGDIVNLILKGSCSEFTTEEDELEKNYKGKVYFNNGYCVKTDDYCPSLTNYLKVSIQIIGNIYEIQTY